MIRDQVLTILAGDATLTGLLTGGVHAAVEISRQETPGAFDGNGELLPSALVKMETSSAIGPYMDSARTYVRIAVYQRAGTDVIDQAVERIFDLLNDARLAGCWDMRHTDDLYDYRDDVLSCTMHMSRYAATLRR